MSDFEYHEFPDLAKAYDLIMLIYKSLSYEKIQEMKKSLIHLEALNLSLSTLNEAHKKVIANYEDLVSRGKRPLDFMTKQYNKAKETLKAENLEEKEKEISELKKELAKREALQVEKLEELKNLIRVLKIQYDTIPNEWFKEGYTEDLMNLLTIVNREALSRKELTKKLTTELPIGIFIITPYMFIKF